MELTKLHSHVIGEGRRREERNFNVWFSAPSFASYTQLCFLFGVCGWDGIHSDAVRSVCEGFGAWNIS